MLGKHKVRRGSCPLRDLRCCVRHSRGSMSRSSLLRSIPVLPGNRQHAVSPPLALCLCITPASRSSPGTRIHLVPRCTRAAGQGRDSFCSFVEFNACQGKWIAPSFVSERKKRQVRGGCMSLVPKYFIVTVYCFVR